MRTRKIVYQAHGTKFSFAMQTTLVHFHQCEGRRRRMIFLASLILKKGVLVTFKVKSSITAN